MWFYLLLHPSPLTDLDLLASCQQKTRVVGRVDHPSTVPDGVIAKSAAAFVPYLLSSKGRDQDCSTIWTDESLSDRSLGTMVQNIVSLCQDPVFDNGGVS